MKQASNLDAIRRNIFLVLGVAVFFFASGVGYLYWFDRKAEQANEILDRYHLNTILHISNIEGYLLLLGEKLRHDLGADVNKNPDLRYLDRYEPQIYGIGKSLGSVVKLQNEFKEPDFDFLLGKLNQDFDALRGVLVIGEGTERDFYGNLESRLHPFLVSLDQLRRLHIVTYKVKFSQIQSSSGKDKYKIAGVFIFLFFAGFWIVVNIVSDVDRAIILLETKDVELRESEARLRSILDNSPAVIYLKDIESRFLLINRQFEKLFNVTDARVKGKTALDIFPEAIGRQHNENDRKVVEAGRAIESEEHAPHEDGIHDYLSVKFPILDQAGRTIAICGISTDITERKRSELEIERLNRSNEQILSSAGEGIYGLDLNGNTTFCNPAAEQITGRSPEEIVGKSQHDLIHHSRSDGTPYPREECPIYATFKDGKIHQTDEEVFWKKDGTCFPVEYISRPIHENGEVVGAVVTFSDISERKKAEAKLKFYAVELERSNSDLEEFAYIASHDLQEPLRKIITFSGLLKKKVTNIGEEGKDYLDRMQNAAGRMKSLIEDLLQFSRIAKSDKVHEPVDLKNTVHAVLEDLELQIKDSGAQVHIGELPSLEADSIQLQTLLQNLISNALKYRKKGIAPVIRVNSSYCGQTKRWQIEVEDNGIGIEEKHFARIFKLFERLHGRSAYEGTGIGLAICEKIVHRHGGSISVRSKAGEGAVFSISLPENQDASRM